MALEIKNIGEKLDGVLSIKTFINAVGYLCLALSAYFAILLGELFWSEPDNNLPSLAQANAAANSNDSLTATLEEYNVINKRNIFGKFPEKVKNTGKPEKKTTLKLRLVGTNAGEKKFAIIENTKSKEQDVFDIDDNIFDTGAKLVSVSSDKVQLERQGELETLEIEEGESSGSDEGGKGDISANEDSTEFTVPEEELNEALANLPKLLSQARAVPFFRNGKSIGMRLFAIRRGSLYEKLGMKNGDIVLSVNDNSLADPAEALKLFEKLKTERAIGVLVERNGGQVELRYAIK